MQISKILVGVDGSEYSDKAFDYAVSLIQNHKQQLLIVHIIENFGNIGYSNFNQLKQDSQTILQKYRTNAERKGLKSSIKIIEDQGNSPAEKILDIAETEKADIIIVGTKGRKPLEQFLLGSTSYKVAHYSKCTVIIVK
ncbi:MAG TPA: universal stress protein [Nitrososphaeraceae archaeon]|nr:universal stress protein [Nitrososphaeraceae archaeon]HZL24501.1 universal stress protein [Nitrososphaeraceae archaeon]